MQQMTLDIFAGPVAEEITVHCFVGICGHVEVACDPDVVHDAMERHYAGRHRALIDRLAGL